MIASALDLGNELANLPLGLRLVIGLTLFGVGSVLVTSAVMGLPVATVVRQLWLSVTEDDRNR